MTFLKQCGCRVMELMFKSRVPLLVTAQYEGPCSTVYSRKKKKKESALQDSALPESTSVCMHHFMEDA